MKLETGSFIDVVKDTNQQKEEKIKKANSYLAESGLGDIIDQLKQRDHDVSTGYCFPEKGLIAYSANGKKPGSSIIIRVFSSGTIEIQGNLFIGTSRIRRKRWVKKPELIDKALKKAYKHPCYF